MGGKRPKLQENGDALNSLRECVFFRGFPDPLLADRVHRGNPCLLPGDRTGPVHEARRSLCVEHRSAL